MRRICLALFIVLLSLFMVYGLEVSRSELSIYQDAEITFINYQGPYDKIDTIEQIKGIGRVLASSPDYSASFTRSYGNKYRVIHAVNSTEPATLKADIIELLPGAGVDHILNLRRIIAGYLEDAYSYSPEDAKTLAFFITVYNAVLRGNITYFEQMYTQEVNSYLREDKVGLATHYKDWPGKSQIVIPLSDNFSDRDITAVDTQGLTDREVVQELKKQEDKAISERKDLVDIKEKQIEKEKQTIEEQKQELTQQKKSLETQKQEIAQQEKELAQKEEEAQKKLETAPPGSQEEKQAKEELKTVEEQKQQLDTKKQDLAKKEQETVQKKEELAQKEQQVAEKEKQVKQERQEIAQDQQKVMETQAGGSPAQIPLVKVIDTSGPIKSQFVLLDTTTYEPVAGVAVNIVGRSPADYNKQYLVLSPVDSTYATMYLLDKKTLDIKKQSAEKISIYSVLEIHDGQIYAVFEKDSAWHIGAFDQNLVLTAYTRERVAPYTGITFTPEYLYAQKEDGSIVEVSLSSLSK
ncbi:P83/100 family protein [Spirochaetia bacterium 38H-sp]|uniref:P83/100 family protein n=1 Tax=Rarispira pelagica TaxID=3141764 RepID=A0ABU9UAV9_9SPIR